jgi:hypothetical protein
MPNKTKKLKISGPGAADFLTAPGGIDFPETEPTKGSAQATRGEGLVDEPDALEPALEPPDPATEREREVIPPDRGGRRNE